MLKRLRIAPSAAAPALTAVLIGTMLLFMTGDIGTAGAAYMAPALSLYLTAALLFFCGVRGAVIRTARVRLMHGHGRDALLFLRYSLRSYILFSLAAAAVLALLSFPVCRVMSPEKNTYLVLLTVIPAVPALCAVSLLGAFFECCGLTLISIASVVLLGIFSLVFPLTACKSIHQFGDRIADLLRSESYGSIYGAAGAGAGLSVAAILVMIIMLVLYFMLRGTITENVLKESIQNTGEDRNTLIRLSQMAPLPDVLYFLAFGLTLPVFLLLYNLLGSGNAGAEEILGSCGAAAGKALPVIMITAGVSICLFSEVLTGAGNAAERGETRSLYSRLAVLKKMMVYVLVPACVWLIASAGSLAVISGPDPDGSAAALIRFMAAGMVFHVIAFSLCITGLKGASSMRCLASPAAGAAVQLAFTLALGTGGENLLSLSGAAYLLGSAVQFLTAALLWRRNAAEAQVRVRKNPADTVRTVMTVFCALAGGAAALVISHFMTEAAGGILTSLVSFAVFLLIFNMAALITGAADIRLLRRLPGGMLAASLGARFLER